jgi:phenylacetic acid degradation operon negative regulatory protein
MSPRRPARPRSQDLVFTLFGDYFLDRRETVPTGGLITLLGVLGMSPTAVRVALSRMARRGWVAAERQGTRSSYGLTRRGRRLLEEGRERIYHPPREAAWDGSWWLISYSIPESRRRERDLLRVRLAWLGCGPLTNGLWITPHDVRDDVEALAGSLRVTRHLEIFRAEHVGLSETLRMVEQTWDLRGINARYASFLERWQPELDRCEACGAAGRRPDGRRRPRALCLAPATCFVRRFSLVHDYRALPAIDPYLPHSLLPADWHGPAAARLFERCHALLSEPADRYVEQACGADAAGRTPATLQAAAGR